MNTTRDDGLLAWQWGNYADAHRDRRNLVAHALTVPFFLLGSCAVLVAPFLQVRLALAGAAAMVAAAALQGRTHRFETAAPAAFQGPRDAVARLFAEQWVTFPRFVLSGEFGRAWRAVENRTR